MRRLQLRLQLQWYFFTHEDKHDYIRVPDSLTHPPPACALPPFLSQGCVSGTGVSADGLHWTDPSPIQWPAPQRYDCHQNLIRDSRSGAFVLTTRDGFKGGSGRDIGIARGPNDGTFGGWNVTVAPELVETGSNEHQLYSQVTFPYYNVWLGLVAVFDTKDPRKVGTVHTRLSWSHDTHTWQWLDEGGLTGKSIIPLGERHGTAKNSSSSSVLSSSSPSSSPPASPPVYGPFDSHIIFPAHAPFEVDGQVRMYVGTLCLSAY